jgi:pilus assembly protein CpaB
MAAAVANSPTVANRRPLIIALVLGAVAAGLIVAYLVSRDSTTAKPSVGSDTVAVVVATQNIPVGTKIVDSMVELKQIPVSAAISNPLSDLKSAVGQVSRFPVNANEQISQDRLIQAAQSKSLSFSIPPGLRGVAVSVDKTTSPTELIAPGDFVDVIVSSPQKDLATGTQAIPASSQSATDLKSAATLLQNVQVLSIQKNFVANGVPYDSAVRGTPDDKTDGSYVTLALTPDQAQLLWLATQDGKVTLTLRSFGDVQIATLSPLVEPVLVK